MHNHQPLFDDLRAVGAALLPDARLIEILAQGALDVDEAATLSRTLMLSPEARAASLFAHPLGPVLLAALELGRRVLLFPPPNHVEVAGPVDVIGAIRPRLDAHERFFVVALDAGSRLARVVALAAGERTVSIAPAEVLGEVLRAGCVRFVVVHNHPGGDPRPSEADLRSTRRLERLAARLGLCLVDHLIVGDRDHYSLRRQGHLGGKSRGYR